MTTLTELRDQRGRLVAQAREALDEIKANTDDARAAELEARHDAIMADFDKLEKQIEREQRVAAAEARIAAAAEEERKKKRPNGDDAEQRGADSGEEITYRSAFYEFIRAGGDMSELDPEVRSVLKAGYQPDAEKRIQTTTGSAGAAGGYTIPVELSNQLIKSMAAWGPMYNEDVTSVIATTSGHVIKLPTVNDTAVTAEQGTEGTPLTDDGGKDVTFGQKELGAYDYNTEFVRFSWQLAQDSIFNMESLLAELLGERLGRIANSELTTGAGTTNPNGIVTASSLGKTATAAAATTYDEIIELIHSVDPAYRSAPKVGFMFNDLTLSALRRLKDGEGRYIWSAGDVQGGVPGTIFGYRYRVNQAMPAMTTGNKPIIFGDFGKYYVRKVGSPTIGVMRERFWPDLGVAGLIRFDGELGDTAAVKHLLMA